MKDGGDGGVFEVLIISNHLKSFFREILNFDYRKESFEE